MSKKIIAIALSIICLIGLVSCGGEKNETVELPPVVTVGLPENEKLTTSYESDGYLVNLYETYAEIAGYKGSDSEITVPDAFMGIPVKAVGEYAFFGSETLTKVTLPDSLIVIGKSAFQDCVALVEVVLGNSLEVISQGAFRDSSLEKINLPDSVAEIDRYAFYRTKITEIKLPLSLSAITKYSFYGCDRLTKVELCPRISSIGEYAFSACSSLASVTLPEMTEIICEYAFSDCASLERIFIPKKTMISENPFLGSDKLTVYSPSGSKAEEYAGKHGFPFKKCASADKMP